MSRKRTKRRPKGARTVPPPPPPAKPQTPAPSQTKRAAVLDKALLAVVLIWTFLLGCTPMKDTDIWWHLRTAQLIVERGELPQVDWFTYTDMTQPWIDLHWGFQLLMLGLYNLGGVNALVLFKAIALTIVVALGWIASGRGIPAWAKAGLWLLPIICLSGRALERPEMLSLIFLGLWLWIIGRIETRPKLIWLLPVIQVAWINCHALFVLGLVVGAAYAVDRCAREFARGRWGLVPPPEQPRPFPLFYAGLLTVLASLVNPYFEEGALFPFVLYRKFSVDQELYSVIGEFKRPIDFILEHGLGNLYLLSEIGVGVITAASFVWLAMWKRVHVLQLLLFAGFAHLAWEASRNTSLFALVSGVLLCRNSAEILALRASRPAQANAATHKKRTARRSAAHSVGTPSSGGVRSLPGSVSPVMLLGFLYAALIVLVLTGVWTALGREGKRLALGEGRGWYAHAAAQFAGRPGFPERAFISNTGQAAVYIFHNAPQRRVFMDARLEVATKETFQLYNHIRLLMNRSDPKFMELLKDPAGNLPVVILDSRYSRGDIQGLLRMPEWRLVFADPAAAVFLDASTTARLKLPLADPTPLHYPPEP